MVMFAVALECDKSEVLCLVKFIPKHKKIHVKRTPTRIYFFCRVDFNYETKHASKVYLIALLYACIWNWQKNTSENGSQLFNSNLFLDIKYAVATRVHFFKQIFTVTDCGKHILRQAMTYPENVVGKKLKSVLLHSKYQRKVLSMSSWHTCC